MDADEVADATLSDHRGKRTDWVIFLLGWAVMLARGIGQRRYKERLADVEIPNALAFPLICALLVRRRELDRASAKLGANMSELGTLIGKRMRQSDERAAELLALQQSVERLSRWLVGLTLVLGVIGLAGIGATVWSILR
jgi:hypothetical protein